MMMRSTISLTPENPCLSIFPHQLRPELFLISF